MAAISAFNVGEKPTAVALTTTEQTVTITAPTHPKGWILALLADADWLYHSVAGQTSSDGMPVKANQSITLAMRDSATLIFYARTATGTGKLHSLVLQ